MSGEAPPPAVAAYLRRATWPLPPGARGEASAELHAHLYLEMRDAQLYGLDRDAAWTRALRGAGPAWLLALRLARVHTLGRALRALLLGAALGGAAYAARPYLLEPVPHAGVPQTWSTQTRSTQARSTQTPPTQAQLARTRPERP